MRYATSTDLIDWSAARNLLTSTSGEANCPVAIDLDGGDFGDDDFDRLYSDGNAFLFYRESIAAGHTRIARRRITVTNYPADVPAATNPD